jgi:arabinofuranan 3-O-arabinosyltransferase
MSELSTLAPSAAHDRTDRTDREELPPLPPLLGADEESSRHRPAAKDVAVWAALALISYLPSFLTQPGQVVVDTKEYLYLDPGRLIQSAISMWDPDYGAGTVTHENIGYLFPMGPYYWVVQQLHIPMWIGQRFWMGSLFFAAGMGVWYLGRLMGLSRTGRLGAALGYMLTPYVIVNIARASAIVMPWAGLGWMLAFTILAVRKGGWRYPALFAVIVALVGGVNATSILLVGVVPLVWLIYAVWGTKEATFRVAGAVALRIGLLSLGVSLWWIAGLWAEGAYGLNILKFTETLPTVSSTSLSQEVLRGLGYWYFYGQDKLGNWTTAGVGYLQWTWLIAVSFAVPTVALALGSVARWRYRAFALLLIIVGVIMAVGTFPFMNPTPFGALIKAAGSDSTLGLALRSTNRAVPLVLLGLFLLLGAGITAISVKYRMIGYGALVVAIALIAANFQPFWNGTIVPKNLERPSAIPAYVHHAAAYMDSQSHDTRVLQLPGQDFSYYRWGVTWDPVWLGLMTRPYLDRASQPAGEAGSENLLQALDESIQDGVFVPSTLAPIAGLMSVGDVLYESDVQYERFGTARPQPFWLTLMDPATGLGPPKTFGTPTNSTPIEFPLTDETTLAVPTGSPKPPPVAVLAVPGARSIVRTETPKDPLVVDGDGQGLLEAAAAGLLASKPTIFYAGSFDSGASTQKGQPGETGAAGLQQQLHNGAVLVLTDSNQKKLSTWGTTIDNYGYVEQANETRLGDEPGEIELPVFPGAGPNTETVAQVSGVASVRATAYGNPITNTPEDQPLMAVDGNPRTAWTEGAFSPALNQSIQVKLVHPVTTDHLTLLQPPAPTGPKGRRITDITLSFNDGSSVSTVHTTLGDASTSGSGQVVSFPRRTFGSVTITIDATSTGPQKNYLGVNGVGFSEITIPGVAPATESLRLPTDLLSESGTASLSHQLDILLNRIRASVAPPRTDPEASMSRTFSLPTTRSFSLGGTARISTLDSDTVLYNLLGQPAATAPAGGGASAGATIVSATSSGRLPGDLNAGSAAAVDGNPQTSWMPALGDQTGGWVDYALDRPVTFDHLDLQMVADGKHSIPASITVSTSTGQRTVTLPNIADGAGRPPGSVTPVTVQFPALTGSDVRVTINSVRPHQFLDYYSYSQNTDPVGLAEVGIPGVAPVTIPAAMPTQCFSNLLRIDGQPVDISVSGATDTALANGGLTIRGCGNAANGITLTAGHHTVSTSDYLAAGLDVDALNMGSAAGGAALPLTDAGLLSTTAPATPSPPAPSPSTTTSTPAVHVVHQNRTSLTVSVKGTGKPFWMVLGESQSRGWTATTSSGHKLGSSSLIDGYANGWYVPGALATGTTVIHLTWAPQKVVDVAILASGATLLVSLALVVVPANVWGDDGVWSRRRRRRRSAHARTRPSSAPSDASLPWLRPELVPTLRSGGVTPSWRTAVGFAVIGGLIAGLFVAPLAGLLIAAVILLEMRVPRSRIAVLGGAVGLLIATLVYVAAYQSVNHFVSDISWPAHFGVANSLVWVALFLLAADALVQWVREREVHPDD